MKLFFEMRVYKIIFSLFFRVKVPSVLGKKE